MRWCVEAPRPAKTGKPDYRNVMRRIEGHAPSPPERCKVGEEDTMENDGRQALWEKVYTSKGENEVSWFQESPAPSLALIAQVGAAPSAAIIDIGGGASRLVD